MSDERRPYTTPVCLHCGQVGAVMVAEEDLRRWHDGQLAQHAFPYLTAAEREQLISGTHADCWDALFPEEDDE